MKPWAKIGFYIALLVFANLAHAQEATAATRNVLVGSADSVNVTVESYYRIKWGELETFLRLYQKNHQPLLEEMKKLGYIKSTHMHEPFTHMTGSARWDVRVTIVYRDASAALFGPEISSKWKTAQERIYRNSELFRSEERTRFGLVEEHWDVVVNDIVPE